MDTNRSGNTKGHTTVRSHPERARYDLEFAYEVLDNGYMGHLATIIEGRPHVVPMMYLRKGKYIYIHGRANTPLIDALVGGASMAFAVTHIDGIVLAREIRFNSLNYRSLVVHGTVEVVSSAHLRYASFLELADTVWPGREGVRPPTKDQLAGVEVLRLPIDDFSGKVRAGPPAGGMTAPDPEVWAGYVDVETVLGDFHADSSTGVGVDPPFAPLPVFETGQSPESGPQ